jgi:AcrR family transcriptional regulator
MARPVQADSDATRRRILESASGAFASGAADECSMRAIAKNAGVTAAMLHHYYGSKDDLFDACIDAMYAKLKNLRDELFAEIGADAATRSGAGSATPSDGESHSTRRGGEALSGMEEPSAIVERAIRTAFRFARREQTAVRLLMRQVMMAGTLDRARRETMQAPFLTALTSYLARATGRTEIDAPRGGTGSAKPTGGEWGPLESQSTGRGGRALSEADVRLGVQSVTMLVARYAVSTIDELRFFLGRGDATDEEVLRAVEDHLVRSSRAVLTI